MNKYLSSLLLGWLLTTGPGSHPANASPLSPLEHYGNTTYDPNTGLEWLDLSLTAGQSYSSVLNGWNGYTSTGGFRFATRDEIIQLFTDGGAASIGFPSGSPSAANLQAATLMLSLLGTTLAQSDESRSWMFYDPSTEPALPSSAYVPSAVFGVGVIRGGYPEEGFFMVPGIFPLQNYSSPEMASALVSVVPEPSPATLIGTWLGLSLFGLKRAKNPPRRLARQDILTQGEISSDLTKGAL
jgi:hypothetical protein